MIDQIKHYEDKLAFQIDPSDLNATRLSAIDVVIIDARSPSAFAAEHIEGAVNLPHRLMTADSTRHVSRSTLIVTYCDGIGCNASTKGALNLVRLGFRVKELIGGLEWWKREGYPTSKSPKDCSTTCGCDDELSLRGS